MLSQQDILEDSVRQFTLRGMTTRQIVRELAVKGVQTSQTTVVRVQKRISTGPNQALPAAAGEDRSARSRIAAAVLIIAAVILAAMITGILWFRFLSSPAPARITACIKFSAAGNITGIAAARAGGCPAYWVIIMLPSNQGS